MAELDGLWDVRRVSGLLPPMVGVRKRVSGSKGETKVGPLPGAPFDVVTCVVASSIELRNVNTSP